MQSWVDSHGVALNADRRQTVDGFDEACELFHGYYLDPVEAIDRVLAHEPDFVMGLVLRGGIHATATEAPANAVVEQTLVRLRPQMHRANERERGHVAALEAWVRGDLAGATERWGRVSIENPRDLLALQFAHLGDFLQGNSLMLRDRPSRVLHAWTRDVHGNGYVRSMLAFGLEESGQYAEAEAVGRGALESNPRDPWGVHAVAHVYEMQNRTQQGVEWLEQRAYDWADGNLFAYHNWWHLALFHLERNDPEQALQLYDTRVRPHDSRVVLEMVDASALLWRLHLRDVEIGGRWQPLADAWSGTLDDGIYAFNDVHAMMAMVGAGRRDDVARLIATLGRAAAAGGDNAGMSRDVGLPVARALQAFGDARYDDALDLLMPVLPRAQRFGGSHAQRDVLQLTAIEAALRGARASAARALVAQRLEARPESPAARRLAQRAQGHHVQ